MVSAATAPGIDSASARAVITPTIFIAATDTTICSGQQVDFTANTTNGGLTPTYVWKINGTPSGSNTATFSTSLLNDQDVVSAELTSSEVCSSANPAISNNVKIDYVDNIITGDYLDFSMMKNLLIVSRNVVYKNLENTMKADVIELDTTSKDTKIFMENNIVEGFFDQKKVIVEGTE